LHRFELQLWEPERGGWRVVVTASDPARLVRTARTLAWQTQKPVRVLGPDGAVVHATDDVAAADEPASRG
jgi:hypothetical protein